MMPFISLVYVYGEGCPLDTIKLAYRISERKLKLTIEDMNGTFKSLFHPRQECFDFI